MTPLPDDDPRRALTVARPDDPDLPHLAVVGDTYTVLVSSEQTGGRYALIDMFVHAGAARDVRHRHLLAVSADQLGRRVQHSLAVGGGVLAWLARHAADDRSAKRMVSSA